MSSEERAVNGNQCVEFKFPFVYGVGQGDIEIGCPCSPRLAPIYTHHRINRKTLSVPISR